MVTRVDSDELALRIDYDGVSRAQLCFKLHAVLVLRLLKDNLLCRQFRREAGVFLYNRVYMAGFDEYVIGCVFVVYNVNYRIVLKLDFIARRAGVYG